MSRIVNGYDLVGLTAMSFQYREALALADIAKQAGAQTVFGGYHPTLAAEEIGSSPDAALIDYIVRGEGEATFRELVMSMLAAKSPRGILGLSYHEEEGNAGGMGDVRGAKAKGKKMVHNPPRPLLSVEEIDLPRAQARAAAVGHAQVKGHAHQSNVQAARLPLVGRTEECGDAAVRGLHHLGREGLCDLCEPFQFIVHNISP